MTGASGARRWSFACGNIPPTSTGHEPEFTSRDELCVLNAADDSATLEITIHHTEREPVGPYRVAIEAGRVCHVRINDLIDPHAVPLGVPYGIVIESDVPVVAQLARLDTRNGGLATALVNGVAG